MSFVGIDEIWNQTCPPTEPFSLKRWVESARAAMPYVCAECGRKTSNEKLQCVECFDRDEHAENLGVGA